MPQGLRDPNTNLTYGVKYLAGAYRAANGDHDRAVHYYAGGYYYAAKRQRLEPSSRQSGEPSRWLEPNGSPQPTFGQRRTGSSPSRRNAAAQVPARWLPGA